MIRVDEPRVSAHPIALNEPGQISREGDRRKNPTPRFSRYSFRGGRRGAVRRTHESEGSFVDLYGPRLLLIIGWVVLMNTADSFFTLIHLQTGAVELNPVAAALLETGRVGFVAAKSVLISVALVVLCVHKNFTLARAGLYVASGAYTTLVVYHLVLFFI